MATNSNDPIINALKGADEDIKSWLGVRVFEPLIIKPLLEDLPLAQNLHKVTGIPHPDEFLSSVENSISGVFNNLVSSAPHPNGSNFPMPPKPPMPNFNR